MNVSNIAIAISILSLIISMAVFLYAIDIQNKTNVEYSNLNSKIDDINGKITNINNKINQNSDDINQNSISIKNLEEKFNTTIISQQSEIKSLTSDLEKYNAELSNKLSWISSNVNIKNFSEYSTEKSLLNKCVGTEINLGCVWYVIHDKLGMKYIDDSVFNTTDTLFNLSEIYNHGGGDCEDLSLLFSASVRYLMNKYNTNEFNAWTDGNEKYIIYSTSNTEYYMSNANEKHFKANYLYVTCFEKSSMIGHCIVSFCREKVRNYTDLYNCTNVEPQDYGKLTNVGPIWLYISSNDLCMPINNKTKCFTDFEKGIQKILG